MSETFTGSCLCGTVAYKITGSADRFFHCHCNRCQKASGTGHASNVIITKPESAEWVRGEDQLARYKVAEAKRFSTCFCSNCGSPMPRIPPEKNFAVIPAGSLDIVPTIAPQARIFWESRSPWSCTDEDIPQFEKYPT